MRNEELELVDEEIYEVRKQIESCKLHRMNHMLEHLDAQLDYLYERRKTAEGELIGNEWAIDSARLDAFEDNKWHIEWSVEGSGLWHVRNAEAEELARAFRLRAALDLARRAL